MEGEAMYRTGLGQPRIIQGGMGVAISGWPLAKAVAATGQMGVVSGTALEIICARRLQDGDPGGHVRRALAQFPIPGIAERILRTYYLPVGRKPAAPYRPVLRFTLNPAAALQELTVAANFVEVFLAKEGTDGPVGVNYLRKIEFPIPFACYGAMLAGVDHILVGAGNPADLPMTLDRLAKHEPVAFPVRVQGATSADGDFAVHFDPRTLWPDTWPPTLTRPRLDAIVASVDLATALADNPTTRPDGYVVEGPPAGGHNAPPRGPRHLDERGQPVYGDADTVTPRELAGIGLPFWMAGGYGNPARLADAARDGATGVQVGTAFALCRESGMAEQHKLHILDQVAAGHVQVRTDPRVSPTGFPFKVVELDGTLSDEHVYADRPRICDLGALRSAYRTAEGAIAYRCPAEPTAVYERHGGRTANTLGRRCLCNALMATPGLAQVRPGGYHEPAIVTAGTDFTAARHLLSHLPPGQTTYTARDVITYLLGDQPSP
jgi:NAD(P)H-dependent flavin oxidoreductase YrpB (nitropropane dioxygenase family)